MNENLTKCQCCGSQKITKAYDDSFFNLPVLKCADCSVYFADYNEERSDMKEYYSETYWSTFRNVHNKKIEEGVVDDAYVIKKLPKFLRQIVEATGIRKSLARSQFNYLKPYIKGKDLLELGSGEGFVLEMFEDHGFQVYGIEPSKVNRQIINKKLRNGKCDTDFVENVSKSGKKFDVIIMSHVLEHLVNHRQVLEDLKKVLSKDGVLFIEVPNCENKETLEHSIKTQPHLHHFTRHGLEKLMEQLDYKIIRIDIFDARVISITEHFRYMILWVFGGDYYTPASGESGNNLRLIATHLH